MVLNFHNLPGLFFSILSYWSFRYQMVLSVPRFITLLKLCCKTFSQPPLEHWDLDGEPYSFQYYETVLGYQWHWWYHESLNYQTISNMNFTGSIRSTHCSSSRLFERVSEFYWPMQIAIGHTLFHSEVYKPYWALIIFMSMMI